LSTFEEKLRPPFSVDPWPRDVAGVGFMLALGAVLAPAWDVGQQRYLTDVVGQMASFYLLVSLGFLLVLRCGGVDLSIWTLAGVGGVVAAAMIQAGIPAAPAFVVAACIGAAAGAFNAVLTVGLRLPSPVVTLVTAWILWWALRAVGGTADHALSPSSMSYWGLWPAFPPLVTRMLFVVGAYAVVMSVLMAAETSRTTRDRITSRGRLFWALCASGALASVAGASWLIDHNVAPVPSRPIGDLRIVVAAILAGGAFFGGRRRTILAGLCLPGALLLTTIWRQEVGILPLAGYQLQVPLLGGMCIVVQVAMAGAITSRRPERTVAVTGAALAVLGVLLVARSACLEGLAGRRVSHLAGLATWLAGGCATVIARVLAHRRSGES